MKLDPILQNTLKQKVGEAALSYVPYGSIIGVGTGSTVNYFIEALASIKNKIEGAIASSEKTATLLKAQGIPLVDLNTVSEVAVYIDGADEANAHLQLIKGGGGALTREKIIAASARQFVCLVDESKQVDLLGTFPVPVEVIPMARSYVARQIVKLGGEPEYRTGFITDNGNVILDIHTLQLTDPIAFEKSLNNITGVVTNGIFAMRSADVLLVGKESGIGTFKK